MFKHMLIATDGSQLARAAAENALDLAKQLGAKTTILTVTELWLQMDAFPTPSAIKEYEKAAAERAQFILAPVVEGARRRRVACEGLHVKDKYPADGILETAGERGCDLIAMGSHGYGAVQRFLLGSVATQVLARSSIPVLILKGSPKTAI